MGCTSSHLHSTVRGRTQKEINFLKENLGLDNEDLRMILAAFRKINIHENGVVAFDEFCARIKCEPMYFLESVFSFFSSSDSSCSKLTVGLNFAEFTLFCCFFLTLDAHGMGEYLYLILTDGDYNRSLLNKNDTFHIANFEENMHHCFGNAWGKTEKKRATVAWVFDHSSNNLRSDGIITKEEFISGCDRNKSLVFPAYACQTDIKEKVINKAFWRAMKGLGTRLLKKDIKKMRDSLHKLEGVRQYHDNVDHYHQTLQHHNHLAENAGHGHGGYDKSDEQRHAMNIATDRETLHDASVASGHHPHNPHHAHRNNTPHHDAKHGTKLANNNTDYSAVLASDAHTDTHVAHFPPPRDKTRKSTDAAKSVVQQTQHSQEVTSHHNYSASDGIDIDMSD